LENNYIGETILLVLDYNLGFFVYLLRGDIMRPVLNEENRKYFSLSIYKKSYNFLE
jgi:hypothetical protein